MDFGVFSYNTDYVMQPVELAQALEERGFESLWIGEHTHIPVSRKTPYPLGGALPRVYVDMMDPFVALGAAAAVTDKLKLGTGVCLVMQRDVITLAKEVATLDILSGGRVLFGIGGGWNQEEMENHGTPFEHRFRILREKVEALKTLWMDDESTYEGRHVSFDRVWLYPKPIQKPHPPILGGFFSDAGRKRVVRYCDGWMPNFAAMPDPDIAKAFAKLREDMETAGRDPATLSLGMWALPDEKPDEAKLQYFKEAGVQRVILFAPVERSDKTLPFLDHFAAMIPKFA
jgi:probable F420-dependent oxidoreductase